MYNQLSRPILVSEELDISIDQYYEVEGPGWKSIATTVPGTWLQELYNEHEKQIFSANLRGYLGSKKSDGNINSGIKETAESDPANFFVFNNGVTALVNSYAINKNENEAILHISGISIVNGAQTTGALSSAKALSERNDITVGIRFVQSTSNKLIDDIVRYNNSQNKLQAADFRSGDPVQRRLVKEFESIDGVHYQGGRRGGAEDIIRRRNALPPGAVAQSIAAFHGQALEAIRGYSKLWTDESRYRKVFEESITAKHVLFCYSLISAIREKKMSLNNCIRSSNGRNITKRDEKTLELLNIRGAQYLLAQSISNAFEEVVGKQILNRYKLRFSEPISEEEYKRKWNELLTLLFVSSKRIVDEIGSNRRVTNEIVSKVSDVVSEILGLLNEEGRLLEFRSYIEGY